MFAAQLKELGGLGGAAASRASAQANGSNHAIAQVCGHTVVLSVTRDAPDSPAEASDSSYDVPDSPSL